MTFLPGIFTVGITTILLLTTSTNGFLQGFTTAFQGASF